MIWIIAGVVLVAVLLIWTGHRLNAPEEPPEAAWNPGETPPGKWRGRYHEAELDLFKELGRRPTNDELYMYVHGMKDIKEMTNGTSNGS